MARKKEKQLKGKMLEELLEEALVSEEEQPYPIPENWVWVRLKYINQKVSRSIDPKKYQDEIFELYSIPSFESNESEIISGKEIGSNKQLVEPNDILLCKINPRINRVWMVEKSKGYRQIASTEWIVINNKKLYPKYLLYLFRSPYFRVLLTSNVSGVGGSLTRARPKDVETYPIALPPLNEQKRIAEKVEHLLDKIDEAKQLIKEAKDSFERRRAAILEKAFRGELTRKWREEHSNVEPADVLLERIQEEREKQGAGKKGKKQAQEFPPVDPPYELPKGWKWSNVGELTTFVGSGITPKGGREVYVDDGVPFIRSQNVWRIRLDLSDLAYITEEMHQKMSRTHLQGGETLLNITGASIGRAARLPDDFSPANVNQHVCILRFSDLLNTYLPVYWINTPILQKILMDTQQGVTRQGLNYEQVKSLPIPVPPREEQDVILKMIETLLKLESEAEPVYDLAESLDKLKEELLSKAFRGELGTNDPEEESALELLKRTLMDQLSPGQSVEPDSTVQEELILQ